MKWKYILTFTVLLVSLKGAAQEENAESEDGVETRRWKSMDAIIGSASRTTAKSTTTTRKSGSQTTKPRTYTTTKPQSMKQQMTKTPTTIKTGAQINRTPTTIKGAAQATRTSTTVRRIAQGSTTTANVKGALKVTNKPTTIKSGSQGNKTPTPAKSGSQKLGNGPTTRKTTTRTTTTKFATRNSSIIPYRVTVIQWPLPVFFGAQPREQQTTPSTTTTATSWETESTSDQPMNGTDYEYTDGDADYGASDNSTTSEEATVIADEMESTTTAPIVDIGNKDNATVTATTIGSNMIRVRRKKTTAMVISTTPNPGVVWIKVKRRKTTIAPTDGVR